MYGLLGRTRCAFGDPKATRDMTSRQMRRFIKRHGSQGLEARIGREDLKRERKFKDAA